MRPWCHARNHVYYMPRGEAMIDPTSNLGWAKAGVMAIDGIHDTPVAGATGVVVQISPAQHGVELLAKRGTRTYAIPFGRFDTDEPFLPFASDKEVRVRNPYLELQEMVILLKKLVHITLF